MTTEEKFKFVRVGRNVTGFGGVACHDGAIVRERPDLVNVDKMVRLGTLTKPFEKSLDELTVCSDPHCEGVFMLKDVPSDWTGHLKYAHGGSPTSRRAQLQTAHATKIAAYDQAAEAEREAASVRESLEAEVRSIKEELAAIETPEQRLAAPTEKPTAARKKAVTTD